MHSIYDMSNNPISIYKKRPPRIKLGDRTRVVRRELGMTQAEFARELAHYLPTVKDRAYGAWEAGINEPENKDEVCEALEEMTGYAKEWFMGWADAPPYGGGNRENVSNLRPTDYKVGASINFPSLKKAS